MKFSSVFALFVSCFCWASTLPALHKLPEGGQNYAVLVAGSSTYDNYRHQADICHAFQDLVAHGIPASNIVVMMYDDIANDPENPHPGKVINQPDGPDVYHGVNKDYTGDDVTPQNFLKVLVGDPGLKAQGKKVLESGPNDNVFIYFADHGGTLLLGFPNDVLAASDLIATLKKMNEMKNYNKLVFYVEACESGSMFEGLLPSNWSMLATTAAGPDESSYGCFCDVPEQTCLGDQYSVNWLIDSDMGKDFGGETLEQQFELVKNETDLSHVHKYGDLTFTNLPLSDFQGSVDPPSKPDPVKKCDDDAVESREIPLYLMKRRIQSASDNLKQMLIEKLNKMIEARKFVDNTVVQIASELFVKGHMDFSKYMFSSRPITRHECAEKLIKTFHSSCFNLGRHTYALKYTRLMANIAENLKATNLSEKCAQVAFDLESACKQHVSGHSYERIV